MQIWPGGVVCLAGHKQDSLCPKRERIEPVLAGIQVKNNKLFFKISGDFGGSTLTANYKVQPRGDKLGGEIEYDFNGQTGELEVTGKREAEKKKDAK